MKDIAGFLMEVDRAQVEDLQLTDAAIHPWWIHIIGILANTKTASIILYYYY
jgi:hypothetical protein